MDAAVRLRRQRCAAQLLDDRPRRSPEQVVRHLLGVQAQERRAARLALRSRATGFAAADVDRAIAEDRTLVAGWLMRGTIHLVCRDDYGWLLGLMTPPRLNDSARRLSQEGLDAAAVERGLALIARWVAEEGPIERPALRDRLASAGIPTDGQAFVHLVRRSALLGQTVSGPVRGGLAMVADARDWLGETPPSRLEGQTRDRALAELARRYLAAHAPAGDADLASWAGLPLRDARAGLRAIAGELAELDGGLLTHRTGAGPHIPAPAPPRLLGAFEEYLLGWKDRSFALAGRDAEAVLPGGGILRPAIAADGELLGGWRWDGRRVRLMPFEALPAEVDDALRDDAADVARYEGVTPRPPATA